MGVNVTPSVQLFPAPTLAPQVLLATAKSPVAVGFETLSAVLRRLVSVTVCAALLLPTLALANVTLAGETLTVKGVTPTGLEMGRLLPGLPLGLTGRPRSCLSLSATLAGVATTLSERRSGGRIAPTGLLNPRPERFKGVWANPTEPRPRRQRKRKVPPRNRLFPLFAGLVHSALAAVCDRRRRSGVDAPRPTRRSEIDAPVRRIERR